MKLFRIFIVTMLILFCSMGIESCNSDCSFQDGDIIFQKSKSSQSKAIKEVTGSDWTHMGILFKQSNHWVVYEAVQPVKITPLKDFIKRGRKHEYVVKRLRSGLTKRQKDRLKLEASKYLGSPYDLFFEPSDKAIYCSELVWKAYDRSLNIKIGHFVAFETLNYRSSEALRLAKHRYSRAKIQFKLKKWKKQKVVTPVDMMHSSKLIEIPHSSCS